MGTEVLRPHDCLTERIRLPPAMVYPRRRSSYNSHSVKPSRSRPAPVRSEQKKKATESSPTISRRYSLDDLKQSKHNHNQQQQQLVMGQITILKRGEPLDLKPRTAKLSSGNDLIVSGTERIGPDPVTVTKQVRIRDPKTDGRSRSLSPTPAVYAGSAFSVSPSPESLPLPSFSKKKQVSITVDDSATRDLRRLLRLD